MRTRLIRPEFWSDADMADLPADVRLTFMGLWCLSDDEGYFVWHPREIAAELYRYQQPADREEAVLGHLDALTEAHRIEALPCLRHGRVPSMAKHRIQSGRHTFLIRDLHRNACESLRVLPGPSASRSVSDTVSVSDSESESGPAGNGTTLRETMLAQGGFVAELARRPKIASLGPTVPGTVARD